MKRVADEDGSLHEPSDGQSSDNKGVKRTRKKQLWTRIKQRSTDKLRRDQTVEKVEGFASVDVSDDTRATQADILDLTLDFLQRFAQDWPMFVSSEVWAKAASALAASVMPDADTSDDSEENQATPLIVAPANELQHTEEPEEQGDSAEWANIFMERSDLIVLVARSSGEILYASSLARKLLDLGPEVVASGMFLQDFVYHPERSILQSQLQSCVNCGVGHSRNVRTNIGSSRGAMIPMEVRMSAVASKEGTVVMLEGSPQIPLQLSEYLEFPCMTCISVHDAEGRIISANSHLYEIMGIRTEDLRGGIIMMMHHKEDQARTLRCQRYLASAGRMGVIRRGLLRVTYRAYHARLQHYVWLTSELGTEEGPDGPRIVALTWFDHPFAGLYAAPTGDPQERDMKVSVTAMANDLREENIRLERDLTALKGTSATNILSSPEGSTHSAPVTRQMEKQDIQIGRTQSAPARSTPPTSDSTIRTPSSKSRPFGSRGERGTAGQPEEGDHQGQLSVPPNGDFGPRPPHSARVRSTHPFARPQQSSPPGQGEYPPFSSDFVAEQDMYRPLVADRSIPSDLPPRDAHVRNGYNMHETGPLPRVSDQPRDMPRTYRHNPPHLTDEPEMRHEWTGTYTRRSTEPPFSSTMPRPSQHSYPEPIRAPSKPVSSQSQSRSGPFGPQGYQHLPSGFGSNSPHGSASEPYLYGRIRPEIAEPIDSNRNGLLLEPGQDYEPDMSRWAVKNVKSQAQQKLAGDKECSSGTAGGGFYAYDRGVIDDINRFPPGERYRVEGGPVRPWDEPAMMDPRQRPMTRGGMPYY